MHTEAFLGFCLQALPRSARCSPNKRIRARWLQTGVDPPPLPLSYKIDGSHQVENFAGHDMFNATPPLGCCFRPRHRQDEPKGIPQLILHPILGPGRQVVRNLGLDTIPVLARYLAGVRLSKLSRSSSANRPHGLPAVQDGGGEWGATFIIK